MVVERIVDVRDLEPPRPLETVLAAVRDLPRGTCVVVLHRRDPVPLYPLLADLGLSHRTIAGDDPPFRIVIWRADDPAATARCGPADVPPPDAPGPCR